MDNIFCPKIRKTKSTTESRENNFGWIEGFPPFICFIMNSKSLGLDGKENPSLAPSSSGYHPSTLVRQSSIYSLTIDEFQNSHGWRGKDFGSMNMDEFVKNIWNAEENPPGLTPTSTGVLNLQRQASLNLPETISQKTFDEVWRDTFSDEAAFQNASGPQFQPKQRQPTFGEVTLEEFLMKAGITWDGTAEPTKSMINMNNSNSTTESIFGGSSTSGFDGHNGLALGFPSSSNQLGNNSTLNSGGLSQYGSRGQVGPTAELVSWQGLRPGGGIVGTTDPTVSSGLILGLADLGSSGGKTEADSPRSNLHSDDFGKGDGNLSPSSLPLDRGSRRKGNGIVEKVVERRQRRMIKNRESAARSRARKQVLFLSRNS